MLAILSLPIMGLWAMYGGEYEPRLRHFRLLVTLAAMLVLGLFVFVRQFFLDRELVRVHRLKLVDARLQMPPRKIATIAPRKRTRSKTANWCALPVAVINMAGPQRGLARACIRQRLSDWAPPCGLWNVIAERGRNTAK